MRAASLIFCILLIVAIAQGESPAPPATRPTTLPADYPPQKMEQVRKWLIGLADPDPAVREDSRYELMGLTRADLPALRLAAERYRPLERSLLENLRDIVTHVYLTEDPEVKRVNLGFLGIDLPSQDAPLPDDSKLIITITARMKGFAGYRALRNGDVIVDIEEAPLPARATDPRVIVQLFIDGIMSFPPGQTVHLKVLRQGKMVRIPVKLDARPLPQDGARLTETEVMAMRNRRERAAQDYWEAEFEPRLTGKPSPAGSY